MKVQVLQPNEAVKYCGKILRDLGFIQSRGDRHDSLYFMKVGHRGLKIRVSNHTPIRNLHDDVAINIVFNYPTIVNDCEYQAKRAAKRYSYLKRPTP